MKKASDLVQGVGLGTPSARPEDEADAVDEGYNKDLANWYMRVMTGRFGQDLMVRKYPNKETLALGRRAVIRVLRDKTKEQLLHGERQLEKLSSQYPINPAEFAKLCERAPEHVFHVKQLSDRASPDSARAWIRKMKDRLHEPKTRSDRTR